MHQQSVTGGTVTGRITRSLMYVAAIALMNTLLMLGTVAAQGKPKVTFIYVGPIGDAGWTFQHDNARKSLEEALGAETAYVGARPRRRDEKVTS